MSDKKKTIQINPQLFELGKNKKFGPILTPFWLHFGLDFISYFLRVCIFHLGDSMKQLSRRIWRKLAVFFLINYLRNVYR